MIPPYDGIKRILWLIPVLLTVHNIEEALTMPEWMQLFQDLVKLRVPFMQHLHFSPHQLYISLIFVTIVPAAVTWFCLRTNITEKKVLILLTLQSIIFWNALMPHVTGVFFLGMYNPGTVTAVVFNIPFSVYLFIRVRKSVIVPERLIMRCVWMGSVLYLPLVYLNHLLAESLAGIF